MGSKIDLKWAIEIIGGFPAIMKLNQGTYGVGVMIVDSMGGAKSVYDTLSKLNQRIIIQQHIVTEPGTDYRLYMAGGELIAAMKRVNNNPDEFRANIARGAKGIAFTPPKELLARAKKIVSIVGLDVAGIDFIYNEKEGFIPIEVNSSPGIKGLEKATKINVAGELLKFLIRNN